MGKAKYETPEHRAAKAALRQAIEQGQGWCVQGEPGTGSSGRCHMASRVIHPGQPWAVAHNDAGTVIIGAAHQLCNASDGATRGNRMRAGGLGGRRRWAL